MISPFSLSKGHCKINMIQIGTFGSATAIMTMSPQFRTSDWRPFRAAMFVVLGLSGALPVFHGFGIYSYQHLVDSMGVNWVILQGALYIAGAGLYAARIPERFSPGKFDIWGSSHQIFHVLVLLAAASHLVGLLKAFDYWRGT